MEKKSYIFKKVEDLTFSDNFMFIELMKNKGVCKGVLERLLKIKIRKLNYVSVEKAISPYYSQKGIRLDVYVQGSDSVFDIELQCEKADSIEKRTRYYQSMIDVDHLMKGNLYSNLKESYILFICKFDPFGKDLSEYHFENRCIQNTDISLNDKAHKIFYNCKSYKNETDGELQAFLKFIETNDSSSSFTNLLEKLVNQKKQNEKFKRFYMIQNLAITDAESRGAKRGAAEAKLETAENLLNMNLLTHQQIATATGLPLETIQELALSQSESGEGAISI